VSLRLAVLGSGSSGNATLVASERTRVLVDAGLSRREILKRLAALGEPAEALDAILITHEHTDHVSGLATLAAALEKRRGRPLPVFATERTRRAILFDEEQAIPHFEYFLAGERFVVGDLEVQPFTIPHDAVDPVAFRVGAQGLWVAVCTDLGYIPESVKHHLHGCQCLVLESNHDLDMLKVGPYPWSIKQRVMSRTGHLSNLAVSDYVEMDLDADLPVLMLAHLSENNNHPEIARLSAEQALRQRGAAARLVIAAQSQPTEMFRF
jgi:phosphoribosyl 1,2-cyclic phosphodiesterase